MYRLMASLFTAAILGVSLTAGSDDGAGNAPPIEVPRGGTMPNATAPMDDPPMPPDENAGQAAPQENNTAVPEENKTPAPDYDTKKEGPPDPD